MFLTLYLLVSSADSFYKQFGSRSGPIKCRAWSGFKMFDTDSVPERILKQKVILKKKSADDKKQKKFPRGANSFKICMHSYLVRLDT